MADDFKLEKLRKLRELGVDPYPYSFERTHSCAAVASDFEKLEGKQVVVAGRMIRMRNLGSLSFIDILDGSGKLQVLVREDNADQETGKLLKLLDVGDIIGAGGKVVKTTRGEVSIDAISIDILSKSLRTMPEKFHGLTDTEIRYRKRYLDLIINPRVREFFVTRAKLLSYMRGFLDSRGYVEFETPVLQRKYGGAFAKPFKTYYNAIGSDVFLRISDELYLKKLVVGGFERVYEVSKDFRNEDIDATHNPEFTQIELYEAYRDYNSYMDLLEEMLAGTVSSLFGTDEIKFQGKKLSFKPKFRRLYWVDELKRKTGIDVSEMEDKDAAAIAEREGLRVAVKNSYHVADALFDKHIKPDLFDPTFVLDFPAYMCPLTKDKRGNPKLSERFELFVAGYEEANCYSELTDPEAQAAKFKAQEDERRKGDEEAPPSDSDFIEAMEYGMPPMAGLGVAIDRLAMILTDNTSLKEVIAFPAVRPEKKQS